MLWKKLRKKLAVQSKDSGFDSVSSLHGLLLFLLSGLAVCLLLLTVLHHLDKDKTVFQAAKVKYQTCSTYLYLWNPGGDFEFQIDMLRSYQGANIPFDEMLVRVFDPQEKLIHRQRLAFPLKKEGKPEGLSTRLKHNVSGGQKGFYTIAITGGLSSYGTFSFKTLPSLEYGILTTKNAIAPPKNGYSNSWIYVPQGAKSLKLEPVKCDFEIKDAKGKTLLKDKEGTIKISETETVWSFDADPKTWPEGFIRTLGFPVIVCPSRDFAQRLKGSTVKLSTGQIAAHRYQEQLDSLLRQKFSLGDFELEYIPEGHFTQWQDYILSEPYKYAALFTETSSVFAAINTAIESQVIDPQSPYYGGIAGIYDYYKPVHRYNSQDAGAFEMPDATNQEKFSQIAGFSPKYAAAVPAVVYSLDEPFNPLYKNRALLNRAIIASCRDLMLMDEGELTDGRGLSDYYSIFAANVRTRFIDPYVILSDEVKEIYPDIHELWTEGIQRYIDRTLHMSVSGSAHDCAQLIYSIAAFYKASGDEFYLDFLKDYIPEMFRQARDGKTYYPILYGPAPRYESIASALLSYTYKDTGIEIIKEEIEKSFSFFNYTSGIEKNGMFTGSSEFGHSWPCPWHAAPNQGGAAVIAPDAPAAAAYLSGRENHRKLAEKAISARLKSLPYKSDLIENLKDTSIAGYFSPAYNETTYYSDIPLETVKLPCEKESPVKEMIEDEFAIIRNKDYYACFYVGRPGLHSARANASPKSGMGPRTSGGISLLWLRGLRTLIASQGMDSYTHHGVVVEKEKEKQVFYGDYNSFDYTFRPEQNRLTTTGAISSTPLEYTHDYVFRDKSIEVTTTVKSSSSRSYDDVYIQLPLFTTEKDVSVELEGIDTTVTVNDADGESAVIKIYGTKDVSLQYQYKRTLAGTLYDIKQLKIQLPLSWKPGSEQTLRYMIFIDNPK
ncbi:hypothetical protein SMSP2_01178 [Limihaloglobus sulfuriphilus]|uniref:Heparinase II/III-like protein n=1 Tax=Limihaloglobus sulfuriphilus TaxID=1851148 RepID=A0A1Q2MDN8_9BACT|nr:hypothetical protein [Limihaloglobus sulfuriphilus]AQQ70816.1 hypothetical protein SMSP2_01178 [Limihaloglobus sulfuriphilus]